MIFRMLVLAGAALIARRIIEENRSNPPTLLPSPERAARTASAREKKSR